jgi:hypothetical protein
MTMTTTTTTSAVEDVREYVEADINWLRKAPKAWSKVAADILAFGEAIESRDLVKYAKTLTAFAACMGPVLAALLAWKAAPSLELGIAAKVAASPLFAAAKKLAKPEDWTSQWDLFGSKRLARLQKAVEALETMGEASSLAVCLEDEDNTPETWSEAGPDLDYIAAAATYEPDPVEDDEESEDDDEDEAAA